MKRKRPRPKYTGSILRTIKKEKEKRNKDRQESSHW